MMGAVAVWGYPYPQEMKHRLCGGCAPNSQQMASGFVTTDKLLTSFFSSKAPWWLLSCEEVTNSLSFKMQ